MKKLLSLFIVSLLTITASKSQAPNGGFENWHPYTSGEYPDGWTTSDSVSVALLAGNNATKGTDAFEGSFCIHLKSVVSGLGISGPGVATNGVVALAGPSFIFSGGTPDTARSRFFSGQYKYAPAGANDAGLATCILFRRNTITGNRDTIAVGSIPFIGAVSTYTTFVVPLYYQDYLNQPDSCLIILQSSRGVNDPNLVAGTELIIDSLNFSGFVGIDEGDPLFKGASVYPSPASSEIFIDVETTNGSTVAYEIYDAHGRLSLAGEIKSAHERIDIGKLADGNYILKVTDAKRNNLWSKGISVAR